ITILGPLSGAHFNPAVTLAFALRGEHPWSLTALYIPVQIIGGILGVWLCHVMFDINVLQASSTDRTGVAQWVSEVFATMGLLFVIFGGLRSRPDAVPTLVALYITGAYFFTSSTSFANPAVTIARAFTDTFAGINPAHVAGFIAAQLIGLVVILPVLRFLFRSEN
ncbi:MAG: aquaporin, partial [Pseudomonadota bacterium]